MEFDIWCKYSGVFLMFSEESYLSLATKYIAKSRNWFHLFINISKVLEQKKESLEYMYIYSPSITHTLNQISAVSFIHENHKH